VSGDLVERDDSRLAAFLTAAQSAPPVDPEQAMLDIVRRILSAGDAAEVLDQQTGIHARDVLDQPLQIVGFDYNESDFGGTGPQFYMLLRCVDDDGQEFRVTCGAVNVMAQLYRLGELGALPIRAKIVEASKTTAAGFTPMWLETVTPDF